MTWADANRRERSTIYEYAGGRTALLRLAAVQYQRCVTDPVLIEIFGTDARPGHVEHLADWLTEVLGGPRLYTQYHGGHAALLGHHAGLDIQERHRARFVEVFVEAADEVGLPTDDVFRRRLLDYLNWGSTIAQAVSQPGADTSSDQPVPVWRWEDEEPQG
ncbi:MAG TPA: group II truncated hemoglobin [Galbitalea sp.]|jgi:truncated hemoglobin YjbI|nr:group II truncated hemoglobin [Galbitalea sp.]